MDKQQAQKELDTIKDRVKELERIIHSPESGRWKPNKDYYYMVDSDLNVNHVFYKDDSIDKALILTRRCFKTKEEAQTHADNIRLKYQILDRIEELNEGWKPDWEIEEVKCSFYYSHYRNKISIDSCYTCKSNPSEYYFKSRETGERLIKEYGNKLKVLFEL